MTRRKDVYHGTLECFIYVLIRHVPVFHVLQLQNKLQKIDMSCLKLSEFRYTCILWCLEKTALDENIIIMINTQ
jgi:hypothetical protein